ncbi:MAG: hypothetical protein V7L31_24890 [Nostoc sp.]|uniref:hypothetical protein n=1 Tax=Nostoc sp. TaxID=1180 RepID=UPI002FF148A0
MKQPQNLGIALLHSVSLAMTAFGSIILWSSLMPYGNAPEIVDGALRFATTHPTLKFLNIAGNISTDLLS